MVDVSKSYNPAGIIKSYHSITKRKKKSKVNHSTTGPSSNYQVDRFHIQEGDASTVLTIQTLIACTTIVSVNMEPVS